MPPTSLGTASISGHGIGISVPFTHILVSYVVAAGHFYRIAEVLLGESAGLPLAKFKAEIAQCLNSYKSIAVQSPGKRSLQV